MTSAGDPVVAPRSPLLGPLKALAWALHGWCLEHRGATLEEHELAVVDHVRVVLPALLAAALLVTTDDLDPAVPPRMRACPGCGTAGRIINRRRRQILTVCGPVQLVRRWYHCPECSRGWSPTDALLGIPARTRLSRTLERWIVQGATSTSLQDAAATLERLTGIAVATETIRRHVQGQVSTVASVTHRSPRRPSRRPTGRTRWHDGESR